MQFVLAAVLALAISAQALYAPAERVVPQVVYGVPHEAKPATVYGVPEEVTPIKTEYAYTIAVPEHHEEHVELAPAPVAPAASSVTIQGPSSYTTVVGGGVHPELYSVPHAIPSLYHNLYTSGYSGVYPSLYSSYVHPSFGYSSLYPYGYSGYTGYPGYTAYSAPQVVYGAATPSVNIVGPQVSYVQPGTTTVVTDDHDDDHHEEIHVLKPVEPVVTKYEYHVPEVVPQKVVVEVPKPVVPHTTYGLPY